MAGLGELIWQTAGSEFGLYRRYRGHPLGHLPYCQFAQPAAQKASQGRNGHVHVQHTPTRIWPLLWTVHGMPFFPDRLLNWIKHQACWGCMIPVMLRISQRPGRHCCTHTRSTWSEFMAWIVPWAASSTVCRSWGLRPAKPQALNSKPRPARPGFSPLNFNRVCYMCCVNQATLATAHTTWTSLVLHQMKDRLLRHGMRRHIRLTGLRLRPL